MFRNPNSLPGRVRYGLTFVFVAVAAGFGALFLESHPDGFMNRSSADWLRILVIVVSGVAISAIIGAFHQARRHRSEVETALAEGERRFAGVIQSAMDAIITVDNDQRIVIFNPAAERVFGYPSSEATGMPLSRLIPERYRQMHAKHVGAFGETGATNRRMGALGQLWGLRSNGEEFPIEASISQVEIGSQRFFTVILRDIAQRQKVEEQLRLQSAALESAANAIAIAKRDGTILWVNEAFTQLTGYDSRETVGKTLGLLKSGEHPAAFYKSMWQTILDGHFWQGELVNKRKDGTLYTEEMTITPVLDSDEAITHFIAIKQDVTHRKGMESALATARDDAEAASRAKDAFLAALSHELRTPLTPALLLAGTMADAPDVPEALRNDFALIRQNIEVEARLIDDLLDLTRIAHGKLTLKMENADVHTLLRQSVDLFKSDLQARRITVSTEFTASRSHVRCDPVRLQQVFWNVVKNAVKFTPVGGSIEIQSTSSPEGNVLVRIADTGLGIAAEDLPNIFQAFAQGSGADSPLFGGLGLGLSISRVIVEQHGGRIWAESAGRGKGAAFLIDLPLSSTDENSVPGAPEAAGIPLCTLALRVLLVEDHESSRVTLIRLLERRGYFVSASGSIAEARKLLAEQEFDLVISDLGLPDGSGHDLIVEIRQQKTVPAIALSGFGMEEDVIRSLDSGFNEHLIKPVDMPALDRAIARALSANGQTS